MVHRICQKHHDEVTGFNSLKKLAEQDLVKQRKRKVVEENFDQPLLKRIAEEKSEHQLIVVDTEKEPIYQKVSEDKSEHEARIHAKKDDVPPKPQDPTEEEFPPPHSASEEIPMPSPAKNVVVPPSKHVLEDVVKFLSPSQALVSKKLLKTNKILI